MATKSGTQQRTSFAEIEWRKLIRIELWAVRTALAIVLPLVVGQLLGNARIGLMVGLGGLYVSTIDRNGARLPALLCAALGTAITSLIATLAGNITWLTAGLMACYAFIGAMCAVFGAVPGNVGFACMIAYAVLSGIPGDLSTAIVRLFAVGGGGLWAISLTLLLWHLTGGPQTEQTEPDADLWPEENGRPLWRMLSDNLTLRSEHFRHALRLSLTSVLTVLVYRLSHLAHGYWLTLTVLVIMKPDVPTTKWRAFDRVAGSVLGGLLAILLTVIIHSLVTQDILLTLFCLLAYSHLQRSYGLFVVFLTPFVVLLINIGNPNDWQTALLRIGNTLVGGALALVMAYLLRPQNERV